MLLPSIPGPGSPLSASWARDIVNCLRSITLRPGKGYRLRHDPGGTTLVIDPFATTPAPTHPWQLIDASDTDGPKVRVVYGTANGVAPDGMISGDSPQYVLPIVGSGIRVIELGVSIDLAAGDGWGSNEISGLPWIAEVASPTPDDEEDGTYYQVLGTVTVVDGAISGVPINYVREHLTLFASRQWFSVAPVKYAALWGILG